jgi:uncharacterized membrane protein YccC
LLRGWRTILQVERVQVQPLRGLRLALGVAIPLVAGIATGHATLGAFGAGGALGVGFGAFLGVYRTQAATMSAAAVALSLSLLAGSLAGPSPAMTTALVLLWTFGAGLLGVFGASAYFVGLQSVLNLLIGSGLPLGEHDAVARALAALAGGMLQTLLAVGRWPWRRFVAERAALSDVYGELARFARSTIDAGVPPPPLANARIYAVLADPYPFANHAELSLYQRLLDEAQRIRVSLAAIGVPPEPALLPAAAELLDEIAQAVRAARAPAGEAASWSAVESARSRVKSVPARRLIAQLKAAWRIATQAQEEEQDGDALPTLVAEKRSDASASGTRALRNAVHAFGRAADALRAAFTLRSAAFRHALRAAVTVALATALARASGQPSGYWLPIAAMLVLQPAFAETMTRGLGMMSGTVAGALLATLIASLLRPEHWTLATLIVIFAWLCFTLFRANYALFAACITAYVVFLVSFFGLPEPIAALNRVLFTVLGGSLALAAYALWPTWEARQVPARLAALLEAQGRYAAAVLAAIIAPGEANDRPVAHARLEAQLARSNAEESVERMLGEPAARRALAPSAALGILAAVRTLASAGLALDAVRPTGEVTPAPALKPLARALEETLLRLAAGLRSGGPPPRLPALRALYARLADRLREGASPLEQLALSEADFMVDSVETIASLLEHRIPTAVPRASSPP